MSSTNLHSQETYHTYGLKSPVKELVVKLYKAKESDDKLIKGRLWDSKIPSDGTRFVEFDEMGDVISVSSMNCNTMQPVPWYYFEKEGSTLKRTDLGYGTGIYSQETLNFNKGKLHEHYIFINNEVSVNANNHINCHEEYFYDSLGAVIKILKYDENKGVVAIHEMISRDNTNTLIEEVVIDCTPYMHKVFNPGNPPQYERKHKNILFSIFRKYDEAGNLNIVYDDSKQHLKEYNEEGKLIKWSSIDKDHETIKSSSTYIYLDNGLLSKVIRSKDGEKSISQEYNYTYNEKGDWITCDKKSKTRNLIYEREITYW